MVYFEILGFYSLFLVVLFAFAEATNKYPIGIIASVLMCVMGLWLLTDGIQIKTSQAINDTLSGQLSRAGADIQNSIVNGNTTTTNITINETELSNASDTGSIIWTYQDIPDTPYMPIQNVIGFVLVLLSFYGGLYYTMEMWRG
jgi:hypothetical protein